MQTPPDLLPSVVKQHDNELDDEFFNMLTATAETIAADGQPQVAQGILASTRTIIRTQFFWARDYISDATARRRLSNQFLMT